MSLSDKKQMIDNYCMGDVIGETEYYKGKDVREAVKELKKELWNEELIGWSDRHEHEVFSRSDFEDKIDEIFGEELTK